MSPAMEKLRRKLVALIRDTEVVDGDAARNWALVEISYQLERIASHLTMTQQQEEKFPRDALRAVIARVEQVHGSEVAQTVSETIGRALSGGGRSQ
jgi:hypothetical protein